MKRFTFKLKKKESCKTRSVYKSQRLQYKRSFEKTRATIKTGHRGTGTGFACIEFFSTFFTNSELGFSLHRHFDGHNCYKQAAAWCNYLLNNPPYSHSDVDRKRGE